AKIPRFDKVFSAIDFKDGMTILDIGAGTGQQAYYLASKLRGKGRVFATDISPMLVDYISSQAKERGLDNLRAVLVKKEGRDTFYSQQQYDVNLLYDLVNHLHDQVNYLRSIKEHLKPDGIVIAVDPDPRNRSFSISDVKDWDGLIRDLRREP